MSLEFNKVAAAVLTAGVVAMSAGFVSQLLVSPKDLYEDAYPVEVTDGDPSEAPEAEEETLESVLALLGDADAENGESLTRACSACHTFEEGGANRVGPNLWNIVGASHAHADGFNYSDALADKSDEPWTYENLNAFLADPDGYAPGTRMSYNGMSDVEDRADLIAYLRSLSDDPADLPSEDEIAAAQEEEGGEGEGSEEGEGDSEASEAAEDESEAADGESSEDGEASEEGEAESGDSAQEGEAAGDEGDAAESGAGEDEDSAAADVDSELREMIAAADPAEGEGKTRQCAACHTFDEGGANRVGPNLWDVVGQSVAHRDDYNYSSASTDARDEGLEWTYENLAAYLEDPRGWMPGTKMTFAGVRSQEDLAAIIAYLRQQGENPPPLD
ncbi:c-type cytochrome [Fodinicurvata sediminis]|uniref:c-type cytochrome n=1 Tax=Fodinicurvata sediminis TaxID=1121832 RepID=UPI0003B407CE|nr:cytochrome c family protein [Fodinicurvata sediminis]